MKILYILKTPPDASTRSIMKVQSSGNETKTIELYKGGVAYDRLVADLFSYDRVICW